MKHNKSLSVLGALVLMSWLVPGPVLAAKPPKSLLIADMDVALEPGVWHGWVMQPSTGCGGYIVEVTPLEASASGAYVERAVVQPEYDGVEWNDVLRVMIPGDQPALDVNVRVYQTGPLPIVLELETVLQAGEWMGWVVGPASMDRAYVVEVTPLEPSVDGAFVERAMVQQEYYTGEWTDVLRVMMPPWSPSVWANVRVYATQKTPVVAKFDAELQPGDWITLPLRPSAARGAYIVEVNPLETPEGGEFAEQVVVRPEFDGKRWMDVVRLLAPAGQPSLKVQVHVYKWGH